MHYTRLVIRLSFISVCIGSGFPECWTVYFDPCVRRRILHSKGELSEDRHKQYEEFATSYQKLLANTQSLADLLDENMPDLPQDKTVQEGKGSTVHLANDGLKGSLL